MTSVNTYLLYLINLLNFINCENTANFKIRPLIWHNKTYSSDINLIYYMKSKRIICISKCWIDKNCFYVVVKHSKKFHHNDSCHFYNYNLISKVNFSASPNSNIYLKSKFKII